MSDELTTVAAVFEALGGVSKVARLTGGTYRRVHNWKSFNRFPRNTYLVIADALAAQGKRANPSLWEMMRASNEAQS